MATIQIREIPEDAYEILRLRARGRGQSIQAYCASRCWRSPAGRPAEALDAELGNVLRRHVLAGDLPPAAARSLLTDAATRVDLRHETR